MAHGFKLGQRFFGSIDEAMPIVKAAANSLRTPKQAAKTNLKGCYMAELEKDLYVFNVDYHDNNTISAGIYQKNINSDAVKGLFIGSYTNGMVHGFYNLESTGDTKEFELNLKGDKKGFETVNESKPIKYIPAEDCEVLLKG